MDTDTGLQYVLEGEDAEEQQLEDGLPAETSAEEEGLSENGGGGIKRKLGVDDIELEDTAPKKFPEPVILYHDGTSGPAKMMMTEDPVLGNVYYDSNDYKFFRTEDSMESILKRLSEDGVIDNYVNDSMPNQFQGTAFAVVRLNDLQKADAVDFLRDDGNGGWKQSRTGSGQIWNADLSTSKPFIRIYYRSDTAAGFKRIVSYFVPSVTSRDVEGNFAVVMYYWSDGKIPQPFVCKKQRPATPGKPRVDAEGNPIKERKERVFSFAPAPSLEKIRQMQEKFVTDRGWNAFHTPRNLLMAMVGEVGEVAEIFQWKGDVAEGCPEFDRKERTALEQELSDVMIYLIRLADVCKVNLPKAVEKKMQLNAARYPVDKVFGSCKKYTEYSTKAKKAANQ
ncbi:putative dCTP pyrophosphatase 1 [Hypsibius exemplaris]|uniref:dCTP pyrophosphatase 1 n=1 Tax=Hypsibius exemplaris TaxID=2072580 RepID=A0A1W0XCN9_HYPEX|nr:putative dCTP pyrophosphatase 1 [Hypsibius exemplaris]